MTKINCAIIQDILPLYVDGVVSDETRDLVEEHLKHCEACQQEVRMMKQELVLPIEKEVPILQNLKKKLRNKKLITSGLSALLTAIILFAGFQFVFHHESFIPYSESLVQIKVQDDEELVSHYYGKSFYGFHSTVPMEVEIDGEEKNTIFLYYTKTLSDNPSGKLFGNIEPDPEHLFPLVTVEEVDIVYYVEFDAMKVFDNGGNWEEVAERADLIWEK